jgi:hypothetical protein
MQQLGQLRAVVHIRRSGAQTVHNAIAEPNLDIDERKPDDACFHSDSSLLAYESLQSFGVWRAHTTRLEDDGDALPAWCWIVENTFRAEGAVYASS